METIVRETGFLNCRLHSHDSVYFPTDGGRRSKSNMSDRTYWVLAVKMACLCVGRGGGGGGEGWKRTVGCMAS